jgi:hypothetical protein
MSIVSSFWEVHMFRLMKLAAYALLGYILYELFLGISENEASGCMSVAHRSGGGSQGRENAAREGSGANVSGPGGGRTVEVRDVSGGERTARVGRGVVR